MLNTVQTLHLCKCSSRRSTLTSSKQVKIGTLATIKWLNHHQTFSFSDKANIAVTKIHCDSAVQFYSACRATLGLTQVIGGSCTSLEVIRKNMFVPYETSCFLIFWLVSHKIFNEFVKEDGSKKYLDGLF